MEVFYNNMKRISDKRKKKLAEKKLITLEMFHLFMKIWYSRGNRSEVSGTPLGKEPLSTFFHHILPKETHDEYRLVEENIIILTPEEHDNVHIDMYRYEEINKRREQLLKTK
jgi:hypothetical protein